MLTSDEKKPLSPEHPSRWRWLIDVTRYDRTPELTETEREALMLFVKPPRDRAAVVQRAREQGQLARLINPLQDALNVLEGEERLKIHTLYLFLRLCGSSGRSFWAWEYET